MTIRGLVLTEADGGIYLRVHGLAARSPELAHELPVFIAQSDFADCVLDEAAIQQAVKDYQYRPEPFVLTIGQRCDACVHVQIAPDGMSASISLAPAKGGKPAGIEDVLRALTAAGVNFGLDEAAMREACQAGVAENVPVAQGLAAQEGHDSDFVELVAEISDRAPKINENGLIDYREHNAIGLVAPGSALMRRIPSVPGSIGYTVLGQALAPAPVRDQAFCSLLSGSEISPHDPNLLTATIAGLPVRVEAGMLVEPVLNLEQVDLESGNVYFDGTVNISGDVHQSMKVEASGDIFVGGTVDGGTLKAGGNVRIQGGVIAGAQVASRGAITVRFAEASSLSSGTVLAVQDAVLNCELASQNQIVVGGKSGQRGRLVGGSVTARMLLKVPQLGADSAGITRINMAVDAALEQQLREVDARMVTEKTNQDNLQKVCAHLSATKDPKGMLERARAAWRQATQAWGKSLVERAELERQRNVLMQARVEVQVRTAGAIELAFGARRLVLHKEYARGAFSLNREARIVHTGPDGHSYPAG